MPQAPATTPLPSTAGELDAHVPGAHLSAVPSSDVLAAWLAMMLDEIDYPMLLVNPRLDVLFANRIALATLDGRHPLVITDGRLSVRNAQDEQPLREGVDSAMQRGFRRLLRLNRGSDQATWAAVLPLRQALGGGGGGGGGSEASTVAQAGALLMLGKPRMSQRLSVQSFGRLMHLTSTESSVLEMLCDGLQATDVARCHDVSVSTVRSQIYTLRSKVGTSSICELMRSVALLPPILGLLNGGGDSAEAITISAPKPRSPCEGAGATAPRETSILRPNFDRQPPRIVHRIAV